MKKKTIGTLLATLLMAGGAVAQNNGGIDAEMEETDFEWGTEYKIHVKK